MIVLADTRGDIADFIVSLAFVYSAIIVASIVVSIAFQFGARIPYSLWSDAIFKFLRDTTEPYLRVFRRFIPMIGPLDITPIVAILTLNIVAGVVANVVAG